MCLTGGEACRDDMHRRVSGSQTNRRSRGDFVLFFLTPGSQNGPGILSARLGDNKACV